MHRWKEAILVKGKSSIIIALLVIAVGLVGYFAYQPIMNHINLGLDLRGGLREFCKLRKLRDRK